MELNTKSLDAPLKLMIGDLKKIESSEESDFQWQIFLPNDHTKHTLVKFNQVWLQGCIRTVDSALDTVTLSDSTGVVRVVKCTRVPGSDRSWMEAGVYCGLMAILSERSSGPAVTPVVSAIKLMDMPNKHHAEQMWPYEVQELANFLMGKVAPTLK